jgi:Fe-S-cluster containining protein
MVICAIAALDEADKNKTDVHPVLEEIAGFPFDINTDGSCSQLDAGGFCKVYQSRPVVCNTNKMYDLYWSKIMSLDAWYAESKKSCKKLQEAVKNGLNK